MELPATHAAPEAAQRYADVLAAAADLVVGLDFDGTLSPIVEDPTRARIHPEAARVLLRLAPFVRGIAVITGRPARQALALGELDELGARAAQAGAELLVLGQYGNERWSTTERRVISPRPPHGLSSFLSEVPSLLRRAGATDAFVEEKGLAVALHTRRLPEPVEAFERLLPLVQEAAARYGLVVEPGRLVAEVRAPGMDKGIAVRRVVEELGAGAVMFAGDDLGDLEAFAEVARLREEGLPTLLVCSDAGEGPRELRDLADMVVPGPDGVLALLGRLADDLDAR